ncbi:hypothetical protein FDG2_3331 [Candidatus Protofrankia californiensis]|uniref:Uncharacterized protein n=1 Tax=Candidatus Protofrankia californiensis TaxID=1839754 RepID=A0A1C3NZL9_9ACTN|nr:hypothetical protein FDG2_3331 [Candidatus Protofrankia californiensis]
MTYANITQRNGSPPRAWGRRRGRPRPGPRWRITPTGVGTARPCVCQRQTSPDHPHGRGDGLRSSPPRKSAAGSPPRAWGRPLQDCSRTTLDRITPTGVGTATRIRWKSAASPDHPHGRGDGGQIGEKPDSGFGSPPRAWGRRRRAAQRCHPRRITPTGVRTACGADRHGAGWADHPHGRGDGASRGMAALNQSGSPPRAWGRRERAMSRGSDDACTAHRSADHPHGRGDGSPSARSCQRLPKIDPVRVPEN